MAKGYTTRKLEVYKLHARLDSGNVDYTALFQRLAATSPEKRVHAENVRLVAIPVVRLTGGRVFLTAFEGDVGVNPLIFDAGNAKARIQKLRAGEIVATTTHALIDIGTREAIIEYNHRGAKASDISNVVETVGRQESASKTLSVELNPVADEEFARAIDRFERIRVAKMRVARPNVDWTDHYTNLTAVAKASDARIVDVSLFANRGGTLSKREGIVRFIKDLIREGVAILKGAKVTGNREGETSETTISLDKHLEHQRINVKKTKDGHVEDSDIERAMNEYMEARKGRKR